MPDDLYVNIENGKEENSPPAGITEVSIITVTNCNDSGPGSLRQSVLNAKSGDTIDFSSAILPATIYLYGKGIVIDKALNIKGPGMDKLVVKSDTANIFYISDSITVTISDMSFVNGSNYGSSAIINRGAILNITGCIFSNFRTIEYGAAIYSIYHGIVNIDSCRFINNYATYGGALSNTSSCTLNVTNSLFFNNSANSGGAIQNDGVANITDTVFDNNKANDRYSGIGGALGNMGNVNITRNTFTNNNAANSGGSVGNISNTVTITDCMFDNNIAIYGGAIGNFSKGTVNITNSTLSNNHSISGAALVNDGTASIIKSTFTNNSSTYDGGALGNLGVASVKSVKFTSNRARFSGGAIVNFSYGLVDCSDVTFINNFAIKGGKIANFCNNTLTVSNSISRDNSTPHIFGKVIFTDSTEI